MTMDDVVDRYLLSDELVREPYGYLGQLCRSAPVYWSSVHRAWLITGYQEIATCLRAPEVSSNRIGPMLARTPAHLLEPDARRVFDILAGWMVFVDPPEHRRLRSAFRGVFGAGQMRHNQPLVHSVVSRLLDSIPGEGVFDLVAEYARPLPALVAARWMGVPEEDNETFCSWALAVGDLVLGASQTSEERERSERSLLDLFTYFEKIVGDRRARPRDDMVSFVLSSGSVGTSVSDREFTAMLTHLAFAGGETTSNLIANGTRALLHHPDQLAEVRADIELMPTAVEELLRFDGPSKMSVRHAAQAFTLGGSKIAEGDRIFLVSAAANRDSRQFPDPDVLDVQRNPNPHIGFGHAHHFCLGAPMARAIATRALAQLIQRYPSLALAGPADNWQRSLLNRSLTTLPVSPSPHSYSS
jgi:cytochrome P450